MSNLDKFMNDYAAKMARDAGGLEGAIMCLKAFLQTDADVYQYGAPTEERLRSHIVFIDEALKKYGTLNK